MSWYQIFYLFSLADKLSATALTLSIIMSVIGGIGLISWVITGFFDAYGLDVKMAKAPVSRKTCFIFLPIAMFFWLLWAGIPNKSEMLLIVAGGSVGEFVVNDENAREIPSDITRFLRKEILEATNELSDPEAMKEALGLEAEKDKLIKMSKEELINMLQDKETTSQ